MALEPIVLSTPKRVQGPAEAEVFRPNLAANRMKGIAIAVLSVVIGAATIVIPVSHFLLPWLIPLLGIFFAIQLFRARPSFTRVVGSCPACSAGLDVQGGPAGHDLWVRCPTCNEPLHPDFPSQESA